MKRNFLRCLFAGLFVAVVMATPTTAQAQTPKVTISLPAFNYDVIYLTDFIDITSNKLAKNIPNFNGTITVENNATVSIILDVEAVITLKGEAPVTLVRAETKPFVVNGSRTLSANDLAGDSPDIDIKGGADYYEDSNLRQRLTDYAKQFPTAPVGQYMLLLKAYSVVPPEGKGTLLGSTQTTITVRNASPNEVQVTLVDPQPGAVVSSTFPTFSWSTASSNVTLYVYEMLPVYQSLQEAVAGIPYLKQDISGAQSFTYPTNAPRRLETNKSYVWFVEASVTTNRQTVMSRSELRLFRIQLDNRADQEVSNLMNNLGGSAAGTFATLQSMGWIPTGTMTLDGKPLTLDDLKALVAKLVAQNVPVTVRVE